MMEMHAKSEGEILEEIHADMNVPWLYRWSNISHYYGDSVRELLVAAAVIMLVAAPFYVNDLHTDLPFIVIGSVLTVCAAAFTSPWKRGVISADAVVSGVGLVIFQTWAMESYQTDAPHQFVLREAIAIIFLFALYFSTKTLRSMLLNQVGRPESPDEFIVRGNPQTQTNAVRETLKQQAREALEDLNEHEKIDFND